MPNYGWYSRKQSRRGVFVYEQPDGSWVVVTEVTQKPESRSAWDDKRFVGEVTRHVLISDLNPTQRKCYEAIVEAARPEKTIPLMLFLASNGPELLHDVSWSYHQGQEQGN